MLISDAVIIVHMHLADAAAERANGFRDAGHNVSVAKIKTDTDAIKVSHLEHGDEVFRSGGVAGKVLDEDADAEWAGECAEMLESGGSVLHGAGRPGFEFFSEVHH